MEYTLQDLEEGIRAASAKGDNKTVAALGAEYERLVAQSTEKPVEPKTPIDHMPEYAPPEGTIGRIGRLSREYAKEQALKPSVPFGEAGLALGETGLSMATGTLASALGGIGGVGRAAYNLATGEPFETAMEKGAETVRGAQEYTYGPMTKGGELAAEIAGLPVQGLKWLGEKILGAPAKAIGGEKIGVAGEALGGFLGEATATLLPLKGVPKRIAAKPAPSRAAKVETPTAISPREAEQMPKKLTVAEAERLRAKETGIPYTPLRTEKLPAEQKARLEQQVRYGMKPTLGSITREPEQVAFEQRLARTPMGEALLQREESNNAALINAVKKTDETYYNKPEATTYLDTGRTVLDALDSKRQASLKQVENLYNEAHAAGETKQPISPGKLRAFRRFLNSEKREIEAYPGTNAVAKKFEDYLEEGNGVLTADDMDNLYRMSNRLRNPDNRRVMGMIKQRIHTATENVGGELYKRARFAAAKHYMEFDERRGIADLLERKTATDPKTATENVFHDTVLRGSLEELKDVTRSLLAVDDPALMKKSGAAIRELQHQTIDHIINQATKSAPLNRRGEPQFSPAQFQRTIDENFGKAGKQKLDLLLGKDATQRLMDISTVAREMKTQPAPMGQSRTSVDMLNDIARNAKAEAASYLIEHVPGGRLARLVSEPIKQHRAAGVVKAGIEESLYPLRVSPGEMKQMRKEAKRQQRIYKMAERIEPHRRYLPSYYAGAEAAQEEERSRRVRPLEEAFQ